MNQIALFDAKNRLSELIERVQAGEEFAITRRGKVVARLAQPEGDAGRRELVAAAAALRLQVDREPVSMVDLDALAAHHRLTVCDAAYLELALRRRLPLATLDTALLAALPGAGIRGIDFAG